MNQIDKVVNYIQRYGSITPYDAFRDLGITKLATVCSNLRLKCGINVLSTLEKSINRFGEACHYKRYFLDQHKFRQYIESNKEIIEEVYDELR